MSGKYDDIIDLPAFVSKDRKHMSNLDRAAQFAPFAALTGHGDAIRETARITGEEIVLSEEEYADLDRRFRELLQQDHPRVSVTYFVYDRRKHGGEYREFVFTIRRIDLTERKIYAMDRQVYDLDRIIEVRELSDQR